MVKLTLVFQHLREIGVTAKIVEHLKSDKVLVFKKKRRKGYRVKNGFRHS